MTERHAKALTRLEERLWTGPGELSPQTRAAGIDGDPLPDPLAQSYVETIRLHAFMLTDRRHQELSEAGWTGRWQGWTRRTWCGRRPTAPGSLADPTGRCSTR